jgi:hypothetical protein
VADVEAHLNGSDRWAQGEALGRNAVGRVQSGSEQNVAEGT